MSIFTRQMVETDHLPASLREKWDAAVLSEGFVPFPKRLLRCLEQIFDASDAMKELATLLAVIDYKRPKLKRQPSLAYLAFVAGLTESECQSALDRLKAKDLIATAGGPDELTVSVDNLMAAIEQHAK